MKHLYCAKKVKHYRLKAVIRRNTLLLLLFTYSKSVQYVLEIFTRIYWWFLTETESHTSCSQAIIWASRKSLRSKSDVRPLSSGSRAMSYCSRCLWCSSFTALINSVFVLLSACIFAFCCFCSDVTSWRHQQHHHNTHKLHILQYPIF